MKYIFFYCPCWFLKIKQEKKKKIINIDEGCKVANYKVANNFNLLLLIAH